MSKHLLIFYLLRDDFSFEELDLDPDDLDSERDELLLATEPEPDDLEDEDRT